MEENTNTTGTTNDGKGTTWTGATNSGAGETWTGAEGKVPAKVSPWTKVKKFLCQDVTISLTPKQEKVFQEVHDFWHQEVTWQSFKEFWLQEIEITL